MKYLYLVLLLLPLKVLGQVKLQDVTISGKQPKFVRLKGYFRIFGTVNQIERLTNNYGRHKITSGGR